MNLNIFNTAGSFGWSSVNSIDKIVKTVIFRNLKVETSGQGKVDVKWSGASRQQDLHLNRPKMFTVKAVTNEQVDRFYALSSWDLLVDVRAHFRHQKPVWVMVWAAVASDGGQISFGLYWSRHEGRQPSSFEHVVGKSISLPNWSFWVQLRLQTGLCSIAHTANATNKWREDNFRCFWVEQLWPPSRLCLLVFFWDGCFILFPPQNGLTEGNHSISLDQVERRSGAAFLRFGEGRSQTHDQNSRRRFWNFGCSLCY